MLRRMYRSRCGDDGLGRLENFLSAALAQLVTCSAEARAALAPLFGIPAHGELRLGVEEPLFDPDTRERVGRVDLRFDSLERRVRSLVIVIDETRVRSAGLVRPTAGRPRAPESG